MDTTLIRRYLQPSPTLRWHPWAPLLFAALLLAFVFYLGARWGFSAGNRVVGEMMVTTPASDVLFRSEESSTRPAHRMVRDARKLDAVVRGFAADQRNPPGMLEQWRDRLQGVMFFRGHVLSGVPREYVVKLAELRLSSYSAASPQWQVTANWCAETQPPRVEQLVDEYRAIAADYSQVLGRTIRPEDLAPAVPGGKCAF